ncbi:DUF3077 domain-containing protein [Pseudomonas mosselii]|uniref:DUF3077 domain-containing protein n=1 Tax=Pseudomonas mosselii TaxID=78327 RepID=UPI001E428305|nr:DUF3077 domain-containing protein [Pseudomonas mosselii]MCL8303102.1 DUF3077 domain-containing protein [Pseudomonas mosselii]WJR27805.1 DUF3077 domain-containing protein [Pseudomonas mosselii]
MSHPKNTTAPSAAQLPSLNQMEFGQPNMGDPDLFRINANIPMLEGLRYAADISEGLHQLTERLAFCVNYGEGVYLNELRAPSLLADVTTTIARSAQYAIQREEQP